jgi:thiol-disulfide isomerase/thioredoxin
MANLIVYANSILKPYYRYMIIIASILFFVLLSKYAYETYFAKKNKYKQSSDIANSNNIQPIMGVYFFHVGWCPHCVKAQPEWDTFRSQYNNTVVRGYLIKCYDIDCTKDNGETVITLDNTEKDSNDKYVTTGIANTPVKIADLIKKYNIDSYPTVKLTKDDLVVTFEAKITKDTLIQFINSV